MKRVVGEENTGFVHHLLPSASVTSCCKDTVVKAVLQRYPAHEITSWQNEGNGNEGQVTCRVERPVPIGCGRAGWSSNIWVRFSSVCADPLEMDEGT